MKKLLLLTLSLLFSALLNAQSAAVSNTAADSANAPKVPFIKHFELGLSGGVLLNTEAATTYKDTWPGFNLAGSFKLLYNFRKSQLGCTVSPSRLSYFQGGQSTLPKIIMANPAIPICIFWNQQYYQKKTQIYFGLSSGYVYLRNAIDSFESPKLRPADTNGFIIGGQVGFTRFLNSHWGLNAEFAIDFMTYHTPHAPNRIWLLPLTIGLRYRL